MLIQCDILIRILITNKNLTCTCKLVLLHQQLLIHCLHRERLLRCPLIQLFREIRRKYFELYKFLYYFVVRIGLMLVGIMALNR